MKNTAKVLKNCKTNVIIKKNTYKLMIKFAVDFCAYCTKIAKNPII